MGKKHKQCKKCENELFAIKIYSDCNECEYNGFWDSISGDYRYDDITGNRERTQAGHEEECKMGDSFDNGCYMFSCNKCGYEFILPLKE